MDCRTAHNHLSAYLDRTLSVPIRELLNHHLGACPRCRRELTQLQTVLAWVRDLPTIEPSPTFLQKVCARVEDIPRHSPILFFRRLAGVLPLQVAAGMALAVSAALLWRITPDIWPRQSPLQEPSARTEPNMFQDRAIRPPGEPFPFESLLKDLGPSPTPLVQVPVARPAFSRGEERWRGLRDQPGISIMAGLRPTGRVGELIPVPSFILRAADPGQTAQQIGEIVQRVGGALLESPGVAMLASRASRVPMKLVLSFAPDRYQALLEAIRQLPSAVVAEERMALSGDELWLGPSPSPLQAGQPQGIVVQRSTLVITILPR